jgi:hypothetical protein
MAESTADFSGSDGDRFHLICRDSGVVLEDLAGIWVDALRDAIGLGKSQGCALQVGDESFFTLHHCLPLHPIKGSHAAGQIWAHGASLNVLVMDLVAGLTTGSLNFTRTKAAMNHHWHPLGY